MEPFEVKNEDLLKKKILVSDIKFGFANKKMIDILKKWAKAVWGAD